MATYLLLRNNKESGPHSLQELLGMGLRPYDLVWVDGRSAAWRYPGEIEELKAFAPAVEEQPYDRFFKKPAPVEQEPKTSAPFPKHSEPVKTETENQYSRYMPPKAVAVSMPASQSRIVVQKPAQRVEMPVVPEKKNAPLHIIEEETTLDTRFSQPLDDIKDQYIKTLQERKQKANRKGHVLRYGKAAAIILLLIGSGVIAGYFLPGKNENNIASVPATVLAIQQPAPEETADDPATTTPVQDEPAAIIPPEEEEKMQAEILPAPPPRHKQTSAASQAEIQKETTLIVQQQKKEKITKEKSGSTKTTEPAIPAESNILNGDRNKKVRDNNSITENTNRTTSSQNDEDIVVKKTRKANPLEKQVSVSANNYIKVAFGGIRNLELTVTNDSKFVLDHVTVQLEYLKPSEQPLRTEMIQFRSIAPNESITKRIQDTNRGIKVNYKIVDIESVQSETASAGF